MTMITYTTIGKLIVISLAVQIILVINLAPALTCMDLALRVRIAVSISCGLVMLVCLFTGSLVRTPWYKCKHRGTDVNVAVLPGVRFSAPNGGQYEMGVIFTRDQPRPDEENSDSDEVAEEAVQEAAAEEA